MSIEHNGRNPRITLVATRTTDHLPLADGSVRDIPGGPAYHTGRALDRLGCPYQLFTGAPSHADVVFGPHGEDYIIPAIPLIPLPPRFDTPAVILSPIMQEIDPERLPAYDGYTFVDLQGFVREPMKPFYTVNRHFSLVHLFTRCTLVKAAEAELARLDDASWEALESIVLVETHGSKGCIVRRGGRTTSIPASHVETEETIGAGDMFLAGIAVSMLDGAEPEDAAFKATAFVEGMLRSRR